MTTIRAAFYARVSSEQQVAASKRVLKPILEALGIRGGMHAFRHGNATALDTLNAPMKLRQQRLGHMDANTTMDYTHLVSEDDRRIAEQLDGLLYPLSANESGAIQ
jgi:integrase